VSVQDLRPNSQDTSAFYLANIYQIFANPNVTVPPTSIPSTIAVPPPFSPPRYAIWVNSLWFLSLVISFTCALLAMFLRQWAYRYTRLTQQARRRPEERARMRAFFADGVHKMHLRGAVEILPALIHIYLFLFFAGLAIFLFNTNHSVFVSVIWWIGVSLMVYLWVTVMPVFWHHSPCYAPLSSLVWSLYTFLSYALYRALAFITGCFGSPWTYSHLNRFSRRYRGRMVRGMWRAAEEIALRPSPEIDWDIWTWTRSTVGEGYFLEEFIRAIPGFFQSRLVRVPGRGLELHLQDALDNVLGMLNAFLRRALSSDSESEKNRRLEIYLNTLNSIFEPDRVSRTLFDILKGKIGQLPQSIETADILARCYAGNNRRIALAVQCGVASILQVVPQRDDHWIALASDRLDIPLDVLQDNIAHGDNSVLLAISIHMTRQVFRSTDPPDPDILSSLSKFDIRNTAPGLQHEFCALWNEIIPTDRSQGPNSHPVGVLRGIRQLYIRLHQGTHAAPWAFDASTDDWDDILFQPSSYPLCNIASHHPATTVPPPTQPIPGDSAAPQQAADDTPPRPQGFPSTPSTTDSVHVSP
jgi:hypothetical protein